MSSASVLFGTPDFASYSGSKHAVRAITEALSIEWERYGFPVCDLMPPFVDTGKLRANVKASRIIARLGINLSAEDVAQEVWALVRSPRLHRPMTLPIRELWPLARAMPTSLVRVVLKRLWR